jgi:N-succinyldiaminopimelate aminotransferase
MNPRLCELHAYPFERLALLKAGVTPPAHLPHIAMSIGEPQHAPPPLVIEALHRSLAALGSYPATAGTPELRAACARWLERRFALPPGHVQELQMVLPCNGTREALFALAQAVVDPRQDALVLMPNPFYQIYEGAALLAGATPYLLPTLPDTDYLPDLAAVPEEVWRRCQLLYLCSPGNPTGKVAPLPWLARVMELAHRHDFIVAADECYTELYLDEDAPPPSLLQACMAAGNERFERAIVFHSLSKRSSVPGLRSGFVAGDPQLIARFLLYRTYHGSAMPLPVQAASCVAWQDDAHAHQNRRLYREKFEAVLPILGAVLPVERPEGGFYLWTVTGGDDERFTRELFATQNVTVLPGSYLARSLPSDHPQSRLHPGRAYNPGAGRVRISLVPDLTRCIEAAWRIRRFLTP